MIRKLVLLAVSVIALTSCSATGPKFSTLDALNPDVANVYIYRPWAMLDGSAAPTIQVDGADAFDLSNGGYELIHLSPGVHTITVKKGGFMSNWRADQMDIRFDFEANNQYFIRLSAELVDAGVYGDYISVSGAYGFALVNESYALNELKELKQNSSAN